MSDKVANAARLIAEPARAAMLISLMRGRAVPAGELALTARVSPQTASEHLSRLVEAGFVVGERRGRHRYYELASEEVGYAVEAMLVLSAPQNGTGRVEPPALGTLAYARTCYAHLAGWAAVTIADALLREGYLTRSTQKAFAVTESGREWFERHGIAIPAGATSAEGRLARQCLDWTERRPHVAGALGVAMYRRFAALRWIEPAKGSRAVRITLEGRKALAKHLHVAVG